MPRTKARGGGHRPLRGWHPWRGRKELPEREAGPPRSRAEQRGPARVPRGQTIGGRGRAPALSGRAGPSHGPHTGGSCQVWSRGPRGGPASGLPRGPQSQRPGRTRNAAGPRGEQPAAPVTVPIPMILPKCYPETISPFKSMCLSIPAIKGTGKESLLPWTVLHPRKVIYRVTGVGVEVST